MCSSLHYPRQLFKKVDHIIKLYLTEYLQQYGIFLTSVGSFASCADAMTAATPSTAAMEEQTTFVMATLNKKT